MGRLMMRASSPEDEEIERPDCYIYRLSALPPTTSEFKLDPWDSRSTASTFTPSQSPTSPNHPSRPQVNAGSSHVSPSTSTSTSKSSSPKSSAKPFRISKRQNRSRNKLPTMKVHARFTDENVEKARNLALENQDDVEHSRSMDLHLGRERSLWYWFCKRTVEPQPNEVLRRLRRLQFEAAKRELVATGMKQWEISALCLEGASTLRKEIKWEEAP